MTKYHSNRTDCYFWLGASAEAETGSREPDPSFTGSGPTGFDPARGCSHERSRYRDAYNDASWWLCMRCGATEGLPT